MATAYLNFRLRGIPFEYQSRSDVATLVKSVLAIDPDAKVTIHSLALNPVDPETMVATVTFGSIPNRLCNGKNEWVLELPFSDPHEHFKPRKNLVFDTHFSGFTPLQETADHNIE